MASIKERFGATNDSQIAELRAIVDDILRDLTAIRTAFNAHVHSGVATGGANSGAPTSSIPVLRTTE